MTFKTLLSASAIALAISTSPTQAAGLGANFTIDSTALGGGIVTDLDSINFRYQAVIDQQQVGATFLDGDDTFNESGFMSFSAFQDDAGIAQLGTGLNSDYKMYALFEATGTAGLSGGGINAVFDTFSIELWIDDNGDTTFTPAANGVGKAAAANNGDDSKLGSAGLVSASEAHIFGGLANGDFQVVMTDLGLEVFGTSFFTDPDPFYKLFSFTGVTTDLQGASPTQAFTANATGSGDLFFNAVPEPTSISLIGIGLLGLGMGGMKRRK